MAIETDETQAQKWIDEKLSKSNLEIEG